MNLWIILPYLVSASFPKDTVANKLDNKAKMPLIDLDDREMKYLIDSQTPNWLVLFYDSTDKASQPLINM